MGVSTHVLDATHGTPAPDVAVTLEVQTRDGSWASVAADITDADGRIGALVADGDLLAGTYRLTFEVGTYYARNNVDTFFPQIVIVFAVLDATRHYHVPILLSPFAYSTYRGS